jgi:hypothetical protein
MPRLQPTEESMSTDAHQLSTFGCVFCSFEDDPQKIHTHLIEEHAAEIADQHWAGHIYRITEEDDR